MVTVGTALGTIRITGIILRITTAVGTTIGIPGTIPGITAAGMTPGITAAGTDTIRDTTTTVGTGIRIMPAVGTAVIRIIMAAVIITVIEIITVTVVKAIL